MTDEPSEENITKIFLKSYGIYDYHQDFYESFENGPLQKDEWLIDDLPTFIYINNKFQEFVIPCWNIEKKEKNAVYVCATTPKGRELLKILLDGCSKIWVPLKSINDAMKKIKANKKL